MKRLLYPIILAAGLTISTAYGQTCDFNTYSSTPSLSYYRNDGTAYNTWSSGANNWEIVNTSSVGAPTGSPYVLHTNPSLIAGSPQWLTSDVLISAFNWQYNEMQWSFWMGRRSFLGFNGFQSDRNSVWLFVNRSTNLTTLAGLEGIRLTWHHDFGSDEIELVEVYGNSEHVIAGFTLLPNTLTDTEWGTTVVINRIPTGTPTGSQVRWQIRLSTPPIATPSFSSYLTTADADPIATATFLRSDVTLAPAQSWVPSSTSGRIGVMTDFAAFFWRYSAEYNQLCMLDKGPVPVELASFSAQYRNDQVELRWSTASEINNSGFEIERSVVKGEWESIGYADGHGTTNKPQQYLFIDYPAKGTTGTIEYRLKQIDRDGSFEYSNSVAVSLAHSTPGIVKNFPNPFNPATNISFSLISEDAITLKVFNTAGDCVATLYDRALLQPGNYSVVFDGSGLPSGTYYTRLTASSGMQSHSMLLTK